MEGTSSSDSQMCIDGPTRKLSMEEMSNLPHVISSMSSLLSKHGCVRLEPPKEWTTLGPPITNDTTIPQMPQLFPHPPFANESLLQDKNNQLKDQVTNKQDSSGRLVSDIKFGSRQNTTLKKFLSRVQKVADDTLSAVDLCKLVANNDDTKAISDLEYKFWYMVQNGVSGKPFKVHYGTDIDFEESTESNNEISTANGDETEQKTWSSRNINDGGILRHCYPIPGITSSFFYVASLFTFFGLHCEDADLYSVAYLHSGLPKVWYVIPPSKKEVLEGIISKDFFSPSYVNGCPGGVRQILQKKFLLLDPRLLKSFGAQFKLRKIVQKSGTFVITAPKAYHYGFNCGFNVTETANFADSGWLNAGRVSAKIPLTHRITDGVSIPWEFLSWKELSRYISIEKEGTTINSIDIKSATLVFKELTTFFTKAKRKIHQRESMKNGLCLELDIFNIEGWDESSPELFCDVCGQQAYLFVEVCFDCENRELVRCINHVSDGPNNFCNVYGHKSIILKRYCMSFVSDRLEILQLLIDRSTTYEKKRKQQETQVNTSDRDEDRRKKKRNSRHERRKRKKNTK